MTNVLSSYNVEKEGGFPLYLFANRQVVLYSKGVNESTSITFSLENLKLYHSRYITHSSDAESVRRNWEVYKNVARAMLCPIGMVMYYRMNETVPIGMFYAKDCKIEYVGGMFARITEPLRSHLFRFTTTSSRDSFCNSMKLLKGLCQLDVLGDSNFSEMATECERISVDVIWAKLAELRLSEGDDSIPYDKTNGYVESLPVPQLSNDTVTSQTSNALTDEAIDMGSPRVIEELPIMESPEEDDTSRTVVDDDSVADVGVVDGNLKIKMKTGKSMKKLKRMFSVKRF